MPTRVAIVTPASLRLRNGDSLRIIEYAQGLWEIGFRDFAVFSREPDPAQPYEQQAIAPRGAAQFIFGPRLGCGLIHAHQNAGLFLEGRLFVDMHGWAPLESRMRWRTQPFSLRVAAHWALSAWAARRLLRRAMRVICAARSIAENLRRAFPAAPPVEVLPNSLMIEDFPPTEARQRVVGVVGGFTSRWGRPAFEMALRVARRCPDVPFRFVGGLGDDQRRQAAPLSNVEILGRVDEATYQLFLREVSVALMPFEDWCVGGGSRQKLLQAAASAQAVVSTPAGLQGFDAPEGSVLIGSGADALAAHISGTLGDPEERRRRGEALRRHIQAEHNLRHHAQRLAELYDQALKK